MKTIEFQTKQTENEIDASSLETGTYIFDLQKGTDKFWEKMIVEY